MGSVPSLELDRDRGSNSDIASCHELSLLMYKMGMIIIK